MKLGMVLVLVVGAAVLPMVPADGSEPLRIDRPWARATAAQAASGAVYLTVINPRPTEDRLLEVITPLAAMAELHTHVNEDGILRMRAVEAVVIPAGGQVEMKPGGLHVMLLGLKGALKEGRSVPLTLVFEKAGRVEATGRVLAAGARGPE